VLTIRSDQFAALQDAHCRRADIQLAKYIRARFPDRINDISEHALMNWIQRLRNIANKYLIDREDDVASFLDLALMYGDDFHVHSWAADILNSNTLHGPVKAALLKHKVALSGVVI